MAMKMFFANTNYPGIEPVEIIRTTNDFVIKSNGRRDKIQTIYGQYCATEDQARAVVIAHIEKKIKNHESQIAYQKNTLQSFIEKYPV